MIAGKQGTKKEDTERLKGDPGAFRRGKKPKTEIARYSPASRFDKALKKTALGLTARRIICRGPRLSTYRRNYLIATVLPAFAKTMLIIGHLSTKKSVPFWGGQSMEPPFPSFLPGWCLGGSLESSDWGVAMLLSA